jgi:hypothetical protein
MFYCSFTWTAGGCSRSAVKFRETVTARDVQGLRPAVAQPELKRTCGIPGAIGQRGVPRSCRRARGHGSSAAGAAAGFSSITAGGADELLASGTEAGGDRFQQAPNAAGSRGSAGVIDGADRVHGFRTDAEGERQAARRNLRMGAAVRRISRNCGAKEARKIATLRHYSWNRTVCAAVTASFKRLSRPLLCR